MGVVVGEGAQAVEFFLAGGVPEGELDVDVVNENIVDVIFEDGGFIDRGEVPAIGVSRGRRWCLEFGPSAYPLVKTLSSEVFPQAPSPLSNINHHSFAFIGIV